MYVYSPTKFIYKFETLNQSTLERNLISSLSKLSRYTS